MRSGRTAWSVANCADSAVFAETARYPGGNGPIVPIERVFRAHGVLACNTQIMGKPAAGLAVVLGGDFSMTLRYCGSSARFALAIATLATLSLTLSGVALGQMSAAPMPGGQMGGQMMGGVNQAIYQPGMPTKPGPGQIRSADFTDAYGNPAIVPASFAASYGGACAPGASDGSYGGVGYGLENGYGDAFEGGYPMDQCGPHYFDVGVEYLSYSRDETTGNIGALSTLNRIAPTVLSGGSVSEEDGPGFRLTGRYDVGPLSVLEVTYSAVYDMDGSATVVDPNPTIVGGVPIGDLFTVYTTFGTVPNGVTGAQVLTEQSLSNSLDFDSDLQTAEISYRRYWCGWSPRVTGTLLAGFRYTRLSEDLAFSTRSQANGNFAAITEADNDLAGFQFGGDMWVTVRQGIRMGVEGKTGIYHNRYEVSNYFTGAALPSEHLADVQVSNLTEARFMVVADVLPSVSLKAGYEVLYMSELALASDNFNTNSPFVNGGRQAAFNDDGELTFGGWTFGMEYVW